MSQRARISKPNRPLSVWIATGGNLLLATWILAWSFAGLQMSFPGMQVFSWAVLALGITISSLLAWMGSRHARNIMLGLVTIYLGFLLVGSVRSIFWAQNWWVSEEYAIRMTAYAAFAAAWLVANYWLLLGKRARTYYS